MPQLSIVVPVRNEAENIAPLVAEIRAALEGRVDYEVVYVDDGSSDDTAERLAELAADFPRLRVVRHRESCGQSTALRTGVKAARSLWIASLDGDGQNDPADIPRLLGELGDLDCASLDQMIVGHRRRRRDTAVRRMSSRIANGVRASLLKDRTPDTGCGLKLFSKAAFLEFPYFDHMHRFLPALTLRAGGYVRSVEVNHRPRTRGRSHYGLGNRLWVGIVDLFGVMWLQRRSKHPFLTEDSSLEH
jgi:glycosyltransferase involved in cell wall biosynthesis